MDKTIDLFEHIISKIIHNEGFKIEDWISAIENTLKDREKIIKCQDKKAKTFDWTQIGENLYKYLNDFSKKSGKKIK